MENTKKIAVRKAAAKPKTTKKPKPKPKTPEKKPVKATAKAPKAFVQLEQQSLAEEPKPVSKAENGLTDENNRLRRSKKFKAILKDLMNQLERNGTVGNYYTDLVHDYMDMWMLKVALVNDIQETGLTVSSINAQGKTTQKKNDSVELRIKVNAQMLKLLSELGIKPSQAGGEDDKL